MQDENGEWKKIYNRELSDLYCLPNISALFEPKCSYEIYFMIKTENKITATVKSGILLFVFTIHAF